MSLPALSLASPSLVAFSGRLIASKTLDNTAENQSF
jgi:hypothetical protein